MAISDKEVAEKNTVGGEENHGIWTASDSSSEERVVGVTYDVVEGRKARRK